MRGGKACAASAQLLIAKGGTALTAADVEGLTPLHLAMAAGLQAEAGDREGAIASYLSISNDQTVDRLFQDVALLLSTLHELYTASPDALLKRLAPLTLADNPWRHSARELSGLLAQRKGERARAVRLFQKLADDVTAPAGIRSRAAEMSAILEN